MHVKSVLYLGVPDDTTEDLSNLWENQIITLTEVVQQDQLELAGKVRSSLVALPST